jgi:hypothetical protein
MSEETNVVTTVGAVIHAGSPVVETAGSSLEFIKKTLQAVKDAIQALDNTPHASALDQAAYCKRAEQALEAMRKRLTPFANEAYKLQAASNGPIAAANGTVAVGKYTPKAAWQYPVSIVALEETLKSAQKAAQLDGTAKKITPIIDPQVSELFSLLVLDV